MIQYPATLMKDGNYILVTFKDVPEAITFGKTKKDALKKAIEALETALSFYVDANKDLPRPSIMTSGGIMVCVLEANIYKVRQAQNSS